MAAALVPVRFWLSSALGQWRRDEAASLVEYALILALIAAIAIIAVGFLGDATSEGLNVGGQGIASN